MPRSGPTAGEIKQAGDLPQYDMHIVTVTPGVAAASRSVETLGFGADFVRAGEVSPDTISPGDTLSVRVWENVDAGLLAGVGQRATPIEAMQVDQSGAIFMPYVGRVQAAGRTPEELRQVITEGLMDQTPDPQVEVVRAAGDGSTVSVMGGVQAPGVYPIEAPTRRLSSILARAGGVVVVPDVAQIKIERGGRTGRIWLQDLYDNPRYDVALRPGDRIIVEEDRRSFTALGASTVQQRVPFTKRDMSAIEAIAAAGGLDGRSADPTGVFIFRQESSRGRQPRARPLRPRRPAAHGLPARPDPARGPVLGARVRHPRRGHRLHHRGALRLVEPGARGGDHDGQPGGLGRGDRRPLSRGSVAIPKTFLDIASRD